MTKNEILESFDKTVKALFEDCYYSTIGKIMERLGFDYEDMRNFIGKDIVCMSPTHALGSMSGLEVLKFMALAAAKTALGETENESERKIDSLVDEYNGTKLKNKERQACEKVDMLLKLFGASDEDDLDSLLAAVMDVKEAIKQASLDADGTAPGAECKSDAERGSRECKCKCGTSAEPENGGCEQKHECRRHGKSPYSKYRDISDRRRKYWSDRRAKKEESDECGNDKCGEAEYYVYYYDSDTMDKPTVKTERLKFDPNTQDFADVLKELRECASASGCDK